MKDINQVIYEKEIQIRTIENELAVLRGAIKIMETCKSASTTQSPASSTGAADLYH
jgi:hypothetical protein